MEQLPPCACILLNNCLLISNLFNDVQVEIDELYQKLAEGRA